MSYISLNGFNLPITINTDSEYIESLTSKLEKFKEYCFKNSKIPSATKCKIEKTIELIIEAINHYYLANIPSAQNCISKILESIKDNNFYVSNINTNYAFNGLIEDSNSKILFRARKSTENLVHEDLLHIPLNKRGLISSQRFSIPGIPCLYFGTTSYACWLELDKPPDNEFTVSAFILPEKWRVLNLAISEGLINGQSNLNNHSDVNKMLEIFPLIIATSFRVRELGRFFKSEYIISHLIMQNLSSLNIDGVAYISKKANNDIIAFPQAVNLAVPIKEVFNKNIFSEMTRDIVQFDPVNYSEYQKIKDVLPPTRFTTFVNKKFNGFSGKIQIAQSDYDYKNTTFGNFDDYLVSMNPKRYS